MKINHRMQMTTETPQRKPTNLARRHFMAAASAAAVRVAAAGALIAASNSAHSAPGGRMGWRGAPRRNPPGGGRNPPPAPPPGRGGGPQCFLSGTRIQTASGEVPIESLEAGDLVKTVTGEMLPVRWVGRRSFKRSAVRHEAIDPVKIARDAIGPGIPRHDLYLSPWHFVFLDGYLMPAKDLINGATIVQEAPADAEKLHYFHLALDRHEIISAEGVDVESLLISDAEHEYFSNFAEYERLYSSDARVPMLPYAERVWYSGGRSQLLALLRLGASSVVDVRDPIQKVYERLAARAVDLCAA